MTQAFLDCTIDRGTFELRRRGRRVKIEPRVYDVLVYLIDHAERVVTKHELLDALWPGEAVSDSVLPRCIAAARRAVGDTRTRQRAIQTVHGRGYRFVADVADRAAEPEVEADAPAAPDAGPTSPPAADRFVGRANALDRLEACLDRASGGHGALGLVVGEPGIGKTRLCQELATTASRRGFRVLLGRCYEGDGAPAYWPWVQILRASLEGADDDALRADLGTGLGDLAALVPDIAARLGDTPQPSGPEGAQARFRLYDAAARYLKARARRRPLLVVVDDLHWADASSLGLLRLMAPDLADAPILLVATYRDVDVRRGHPLAEVLGILAREPAIERIALSGLRAAEIADFLAAESGEPAPDDLASRLHEMTDGNPFFVREIVQLLRDEGEVTQASADALHMLVLPQGVRDAVGRRLSALSDDCNRVLRAASVLGRQFSSAVLGAMVEADPADGEEAMLESLAEALESGLVQESGAGRYTFAHALTRQTLYEELRAPQRITLHRRAATALESTLALEDPGRDAELAHHFFEAAPGGDVEKAVAYAVAAAEAAHRQHAYDEAASQYERALEAIELLMPVPRERRLELMLAHGEELFTAGHRDRALDRLFATANAAREIGDAETMARAAIAIRGFGELGQRPPPGATELIEEALAALPGDARALRARLLARLAGTVLSPMAKRRELADRALELARECGDGEALRDALSACWWATLGPDAVQERLAIARELEAMAAKTAAPALELLSLESFLGVHLALGDGRAVEQAIDRFEAIAGELRQPLFIFMGKMLRVSWLMNAGDFDRAEKLREEAFAYGEGRVVFAQLTATGQLHWSRFYRGKDPEMRESARELREQLIDFFENHGAAKIFAGVLNWTRADGPALSPDVVASIDHRALDHDEHWMLAMGILSDAAYDLGDEALMASLYETLWPYRELMMTHDLIRTAAGTVWSCLGELATGLGRLDDAVDHYEAAIAREETGGFRPAALASRGGLARALLRRGAPGDRARAEALVADIEADDLAARQGLLGPQRHELRVLLES